jgi:short-subunit dehydrogenase
MSLPARFSDRYGPWALVAGASDGIGEAFAHRLAGAGINVVLVARRAAVLAKLADELGRGYGVDARCVVADLTSEAMMGEIRQATDDIEVGLLVYNAGAAHGAVHFLDRPAEAAIGMIALNCRGPVLLAHHFGKLMRERRRGGIMLLSSMAAMSGGSYIAVYNATKSFDMVLSEGLWHELNQVGVDAMCLVVGATLTPSMLASRETFRSYPNIMQPLDVVDEGLEFLGRGPLWIAGDHNRAMVAAMRPGSRVDAINDLSHATASIYGLPPVSVAGEDFNT